MFPPAGGDAIGFSTGGTERMRISNTGNVTIGGTADMGAPLLIYKVDSTAYDAGQDDGQDGHGATIMAWNPDQADNGFAQILFRNRGSGVGVSRIVSIAQASGSTDLAFVTEHSNTKSEKLRITSDGKVGIGTANPTGKLHVNVGATTDNLSGVVIESTESGASSSPDLTLYRNSASPADNDIVGALWFYGNNDADEEVLYGGIFTRSTDVTDASEDGEMIFTTTGTVHLQPKKCDLQVMVVLVSALQSR